MRLFATSDLHTDYVENFNWLKELSDTDYRDDALIVAGDVSERLGIIRETLVLLRAKFRHVLFTPGNHELWIRNEPFDSIEKLRRVLELCDELDVTTRPLRLEDVWVVPLFSWYDGVFRRRRQGITNEVEVANLDLHRLAARNTARLGEGLATLWKAIPFDDQDEWLR